MKRFLIAVIAVALASPVAEACGRVRHRLQMSVSKVRTVTKTVVTGKAAPCANGTCPAPVAPPVKK